MRQNRRKWKCWQPQGIEPRTPGLCNECSALNYDKQTTTSPRTVDRKILSITCWVVFSVSVFPLARPLSLGSLLMEGIFRSTPNTVLMVHTEWLPGMWLRHFSTTCGVHIKEDCGGWLLSGCHSSVQSTGCTSQVSWVWFPATAAFLLSSISPHNI